MRTTTITDPQSKITTKITTVAGTPRRTQDHDGYYVGFTFDGFGSLKTVADSLGNTLLTGTYVYGIGAFQTNTTDMDLGPRSATFNALGEITAASDNKSQNFTFTYDALSRPKTRLEAEGTTTWTWDTATGKGVGQLASVTSPGYSETRSYDSAERPLTATYTTDATYSIDFTFNNLGRLDTLTYPTSTSSYRLKLQYLYANGLLQQVKDFNSSTVFWQANVMNPRGQITQETLGNGIVTNRALDAVTGWLSSIQSGPGGGATTQNESYLFDLVGNVTQRQNNNAGLTESICYDNLYRLDHTTSAGTCAGQGPVVAQQSELMRTGL